ncbi:MAG: protein phosphatase 2C domain-containing protein [Tessaracoccus sp.]
MVTAGSSSARYSLRTIAHSEVGRIRKNNQDSGYASPTMLLVCDGMGGAAAGDLASAVAATEACRADRLIPDGEDMLSALSGVISRINSRLGDLVSEDLSLDGMGTTFCGAMFNGSQLGIAHIGDSRGYLLRDGELTQLTHDHSWVQQLIDEGRITPEQAAVHPHRSLILKVLNGQIDCVPISCCSTCNWATGSSSARMGSLASSTTRPSKPCSPVHDVEKAAEVLARAANAAGGHDNITVVIGDIVAQDDELDKADPVLTGSAVEIAIPALSGTGNDLDGPYPVHPDPRASELTPDEVARYAPREAKRRWPGILAAVMTIVLVVGGATWGVIAFAQTRYFIASHDGKIAIYNGLPGSLLGRELHTLVEHTDIQVTDLPRYFQRTVNNTIGVNSLDAAHTTASELRVKAEQCVATREARAQASASPSPPKTLSPDFPELPFASRSPGEVSADPAPPIDPVPYPTNLAPLSPTDSSELDPEAC